MAIEELQDKIKGITADTLSNDDSFVTSALYASQIAIRSHQQEKLEALRNAVQNSALADAPEDDLQLIYLNLVDVLTPSHLRILELLDDPPGWFNARGQAWPGTVLAGGLIESALPDLRGRREFYDQAAQDLATHGLAGVAALHTMMTGSGLMARRTTELGRGFLQFIQKKV